jgi:hypothetical protein
MRQIRNLVYHIKISSVNSPNIEAGMESGRVVLLGKPWQRSLQQCQSHRQQHTHRQQQPRHSPAHLSGLVAPPQVGEGALDRRPAAINVVADVDQKHRDARLLGQHAETAQHNADPNGRVVGIVSVPAKE